ncbi:hypothetical protein SynA1524_01048 [Synechococcus sp. A15-24]|nr:hypothetical protein SynA1524_01048 [Synechococcus sp. A15-24]
MRIVLIGSFGSSSDQHYRVHQPAAALAADLLVLKDSDQNIKTTLLNINRDDLINYQPDLI